MLAVAELLTNEPACKGSVKLRGWGPRDPFARELEIIEPDDAFTSVLARGIFPLSYGTCLFTYVPSLFYFYFYFRPYLCNLGDVIRTPKCANNC